MTREIALHCMKSYSELHSDLCELCPIYGETGSDHCFEDALQYVIGMLEQESIFDKIRAEIKQTSETVDGFLMHDGTKRTVLQILDKYIAESEKV